ncbi:flagellar export protein FliJ [Aquisalimonas lutea]|uniref:flagellar export protein FliJ n=1 Tax=Aquisalimonas lutea TaxID=1327750 RepID=UPI0025B595BD|nr:flagellar export protein FliJ [Aquisalimonas lutea]MDN3518284.1 flagellar export protein FliJ [Aquisalimonas lutea]
MSRLKRLETVEGVMDDKAERAAREFGEAQQQLDNERQRLEQLQQFRAEYQGRLTGDGGATMDAFRLRDFNAFIARIDAAIEQQNEQIRAAERQFQRAREHWEHERTRAEAMGKVVARERDAEQRQERKREQTQADELAQRMFAHRNKGRR